MNGMQFGFVFAAATFFAWDIFLYYEAYKAKEDWPWIGFFCSTGLLMWALGIIFTN